MRVFRNIGCVLLPRMRAVWKPCLLVGFCPRFSLINSTSFANSSFKSWHLLLEWGIRHTSKPGRRWPKIQKLSAPFVQWPTDFIGGQNCEDDLYSPCWGWASTGPTKRAAASAPDATVVGGSAPQEQLQFGEDRSATIFTAVTMAEWESRRAFVLIWAPPSTNAASCRDPTRSHQGVRDFDIWETPVYAVAWKLKRHRI